VIKKEVHMSAGKASGTVDTSIPSPQDVNAIKAIRINPSNCCKQYRSGEILNSMDMAGKHK
jgi:hypothetical protein